MKVGIDTFGCDNGRSGLGSYLLSMVPALPDSDEVSYELFGPEVDRFTYTGNKPYPFKSVNVPDSLFFERIWPSLNVNTFAKKNGYDVVLYPAGCRILPSRFSVPSVCVINDIVSSLISSSDDSWYRRVVRKSLSRIDCIIVSSEYIRDDLIASGIDCKNIVVIHNGIDHNMFYPSEDFSGNVVDIKPFAIKKPYMIYASRMKNESKKHEELIQAFSIFKKKTGLPHRLVLAGTESSYSDKVHAAAHDSEFARDIFITGHFPHEQFPALYRNAEACVFPSVSEGVGLSVMESMACGLPVACSDKGALKEIAGNCALFFDSDSPDSVAAALERIVTDKALRAKLSADGIKWSERYSWRNTAAATMQTVLSL